MYCASFDERSGRFRLVVVDALRRPLLTELEDTVTHEAWAMTDGAGHIEEPPRRQNTAVNSTCESGLRSKTAGKAVMPTRAQHVITQLKGQQERVGLH